MWREPDEHAVEFGRILVAPQRRRCGFGARLMSELLGRAGDGTCWVRVVPGNEPALALYRFVGFAPAPEAEQNELNATQPRAYVWLRRSPPTSSR